MTLQDLTPEKIAQFETERKAKLAVIQAENAQLDIEAIEHEIKLLAANGDIFENPRGTWRILK